MSIAMLELHPVPGREHPVADGTVIGRAPECDIRVDDPLISRRHARLLVSDLGVGIEDLDSANGLYINGLAHRGVTPLHPGDVFQLGGTLWMLKR
jgi:pSer/pThr/pTyr-binding forkhead associated (FHA) protein